MSLASPVDVDPSLSLVAIVDPDDADTLAKLREILPPDALRRVRLADGFASPPKPTLRLTRRQAAILPLLLSDLSNKAIARRLAISHFTVRNHVSQILRALGVTSRQAAKTALAQAQPSDPIASDAGAVISSSVPVPGLPSPCDDRSAPNVAQR